MGDVHVAQVVLHLLRDELPATIGPDAVGEAERPDESLELLDDGVRGHRLESDNDRETAEAVHHYEVVLAVAVEDVRRERLHGKGGGRCRLHHRGCLRRPECLARDATCNHKIDVRSHGRPVVVLSGSPRRFLRPCVSGMQQAKYLLTGWFGHNDFVAHEDDDLVAVGGVHQAQLVPDAAEEAGGVIFWKDVRVWNA